MNILLIDHYAGTKKLGMEYRPWYLAREWVKMGHKVTIIAASYSHLRIKQPEISGKYCEMDEDDIRFIIIKTPLYKSNGFKRIINIIIFLLRLFGYRKKICLKNKPDVVIASSTYPLDIFPAFWIKNRTRCKLVFELHDLWPLSPMELGGYSRFNPFIMLLQYAENFAYRKSDHVVSLLPNTKAYMINHGLSPEKFTYIPNGIDIDEWDHSEIIPSQVEELLSKLKIENKRIVGYVGSHGSANALESFIESMRYLKNENIAYVLVGNGPEKVKLMQSAFKNGSRLIYFLNPVQKSAVPSLLSQMDILYLGWSKNRLYRYGISPNKLFDYMMSGKPIIHSVDAANDPVKESSCGISIEPGDPVAIAGAIERLLKLDDHELNRMGKNGKEFVLLNHDYKILAKKFLDIMT